MLKEGILVHSYFMCNLLVENIFNSSISIFILIIGIG